MNISFLLYLAATLAAIQYIAHAGLFLLGKPRHGQAEIDLIQEIKSHRWSFAGFSRSYWNFYFGYGLVAILWGVIEVCFLWQLATLAKISQVSVLPFIIILLLANVGHAFLTLKYFFLLPAVFDILIALVLLGALAIR